MDAILGDLSPAALTTAIEANLYGWRIHFGKLGRCCDDDPPGVKRSITDCPVSLFNSCMETTLAPDQVEPAIRRIIEDGRANGVPLLWWTGPSTRPADLPVRLKENGFTVDEESPGMAVVLDELVERQPAAEGVIVEKVVDEAGFARWAETMMRGFEAPAEALPKGMIWVDVLRQADPQVVMAYIATINGRPVATSLLLFAAGVAGIYGVATLPEARGRGIGRNATQVPLCEARSRGYKVGILQSSPMGFNVYRSLGFREYCRIDSYRWSPE